MAVIDITATAREAIFASKNRAYDLQEKYFWCEDYDEYRNKVFRVYGITEDEHDVITGLINKRKTELSTDPGTVAVSHMDKKEGAGNHTATPRKDKEPLPWSGKDIEDISLQEIQEKMDRNLFWLINGNSVLKESQISYRKSLAWFHRKCRLFPDTLTDEEKTYKDLDLSKKPIAMFVNYYYPVPKTPCPWWDSVSANTIAKHYQCIQLAMFLDGRGVF